MRKMGFDQQVLLKLLDTKYHLPDGRQTAVFIKNKDNSNCFDCLLCSCHALKPHDVISHGMGRRHEEKIHLVNGVPISEKNETSNTLPRYKERTTRLQTRIDETSRSIVGLQYVLDLQTNSNSEYNCIMCVEHFERVGDVMDHLTSHTHRLNYLRITFPKAYDEVSYLIELVCDGIEAKFGRSNVSLVEKSEFLNSKKKYTQMPLHPKFFNETIGCEQLMKKDVNKEDEPNVETVSISSDSTNRNRRQSCGSDAMSLSSSSPSIAETKQDGLLETFALQIAAAKIELAESYQPYIKNPCSFPGYNEMWASFWNTRRRELCNENKLDSYDWQSAWASEWRKIMNEKLNKDFELKCVEIKRNLGIADADLSENDKKKTQPPEVNMDSVVRSGDVDELRSRSLTRSQCFKRPRSPTRSQSPSSRSSARTGSPPKSHPTRSQSEEHSKTNELPSPSKRQSPLQLEQLLEQHKNDGDFMISWRDLLNIFEIDAELPQCKSSNTTEKRADSPAERMNHFSETHTEIQEPPIEVSEPVTLISVLSVLTALENLLGILGPKIIHLLQKAIAMDKFDDNSSNTLLDDASNCILFETTKEKLKGLLTANMVDPSLQQFVGKVIKDMTELIHQANERNNFSMPPSTSEKDELIHQAIEKVNNFGTPSPSLSGKTVHQANGRMNNFCTPPLSTATELIHQPNGRMANFGTSPLSTSTGSIHQPNGRMANFCTPPPSTGSIHQPFGRINNFCTPPLSTATELIHQPNGRMANFGTSPLSTSTGLIHEPNGRMNNFCTQPLSTPSVEKTTLHPQSCSRVESLPSSAEEICTDVDFGGAVTLKDSEIKVLMAQFTTLSEADKLNFTQYLKRLKVNEPERVTRLRNNMYGNRTTTPIKSPEPDTQMYDPGEVFYSDYTEKSVAAPYVKPISMAYQVARSCAGVKIKRRPRE